MTILVLLLALSACWMILQTARHPVGALEPVAVPAAAEAWAAEPRPSNNDHAFRALVALPAVLTSVFVLSDMAPAQPSMAAEPAAATASAWTQVQPIADVLHVPAFDFEAHARSQADNGWLLI